MEQIKFQITNIKYQTNNPPQAEQKFKNPNKDSAWKVLVIEYWNLKFIWNLLARRLFGGVLGICVF